MAAQRTANTENSPALFERNEANENKPWKKRQNEQENFLVKMEKNRTIRIFQWTLKTYLFPQNVNSSKGDHIFFIQIIS